AARADIYPITPETIERMIAERNAGKAAAVDLRTPLPATSPTSPSVGYQYLVGHQDILQITVWNHPELTNPSATANELSGRAVSPDGYIFFPYAGRIRAAGRTVAEIRNELTRKLSAYLVEPQVDVSVSNYRSKRVFVVGQVATPGPIALTDIPLTITDLVAQSGGFTPEADL